jgi:hypothetical protein
MLWLTLQSPQNRMEPHDRLWREKESEMLADIAAGSGTSPRMQHCCARAVVGVDQRAGHERSCRLQGYGVGDVQLECHDVAGRHRRVF